MIVNQNGITHSATQSLKGTMSFSFRLLALVAIVGSMLLASCTGSKPTADTNAESRPTTNDSLPAQSVVNDPMPSEGIDACALLTKVDAEALLGQPVGEPEYPVQGAATFEVSSCKYRIQGGSAFDNAFVIVTVPVGGSIESAIIAFNTDKSQAEEMLGAAPVDVLELGDSAYWVGGYGNQLAILSGNVHVVFSVSTLEGDNPPQAVIDFAKTMLSRL